MENNGGTGKSFPKQKFCSLNYEYFTGHIINRLGDGHEEEKCPTK